MNGNTYNNCMKPVRFACFDIGSNAVRFVIAEFTSRDTFELLYRKREPIRLVTSDNPHAPLDHDLMRHIRQFFLDQCSLFSSYQVQAYRAVATSAVRESQNGKAFCEWIEQETSCKLEIISEEEEARLVYEAVRQKLNLQDMDWFMLDIGGGSVQISVIHQNELRWTQSCPMGAVRLWERFKHDFPSTDAMESYITSTFSEMNIPLTPNGFNHTIGIATGGSLEEIARLSDTEQTDLPCSTVAVHQVSTIKRKLLSLTIEERVKQLGINRDRADIILPAVVLVEQFCKVMGLSSLVLPFISLRDGILLRLAKQNRLGI